MSPHRQVLATAYLISGLFLAVKTVLGFDSMMAALRPFFDSDPIWYVNVSAIAVMLAPLALLAASVMIYGRTNRWLAAISAIYGTILWLNYVTIALAIYLVWYLACRMTVLEVET